MFPFCLIIIKNWIQETGWLAASQAGYAWSINRKGEKSRSAQNHRGFCGKKGRERKVRAGCAHLRVVLEVLAWQLAECAGLVPQVLRVLVLPLHAHMPSAAGPAGCEQREPSAHQERALGHHPFPASLL